MTAIVIPITTNNFIQQPSGKYAVSLPASAFFSQLGTLSIGPIRCYRDDGTTSRQVLFYHEINDNGDVIFYFDEAFSGKIVLSGNN